VVSMQIKERKERHPFGITLSAKPHRALGSLQRCLILPMGKSNLSVTLVL